MSQTNSFVTPQIFVVKPNMFLFHIPPKTLNGCMSPSAVRYLTSIKKSWSKTMFVPSVVQSFVKILRNILTWLNLAVKYLASLIHSHVKLTQHNPRITTKGIWKLKSFLKRKHESIFRLPWTITLLSSFCSCSFSKWVVQNCLLKNLHEKKIYAHNYEKQLHWMIVLLKQIWLVYLFSQVCSFLYIWFIYNICPLAFVAKRVSFNYVFMKIQKAHNMLVKWIHLLVKLQTKGLRNPPKACSKILL